MRFVSIILVLFIGLAWLIGVAVIPFRKRGGPLWARVLTVPAAVLMAAGAVGFFGAALSAAGGLNWLPRSFEWPVGRADGVITLTGGEHVVPLIPSARVQVYDAHWRFLCGWHVDAGGGNFALRALPDQNIEVLGSRRATRLVFTPRGDLVSRSDDPRTRYIQLPHTGNSALVPTRWWMAVFTTPLRSWLAIALGVVLMMIVSRVKAGGARNLATPARAMTGDFQPLARLQRVRAHVAPAQAKDSGAAAVRPPGTEWVPQQSFSAASYGCLGSVCVWTLGWVGVAALAWARVRRSVDAAAVVGLLVSVVMSAVGFLAVGSALGTQRSNESDPPDHRTWGRRLLGWFAGAFWCAAAVAWNFGVFALLIRSARDGHGWVLLVLVLWSLIGLFLLNVLFVAIGSLIDSVLGLFR